MAQCWQRQNWKLLLVSTLVFCGVSTNSRNCALAQIAPDTTLGAERSVVTPNILINNQLSDRIDSGAIRGANLFHSFSEFNVGNQRGVYFTNPVGIQNILSRVTGNNPSNIQGTLGVLGNANLFLINPNGIIFGQNASLDVNGSFVATTANGIQFENLGTFSATNPEAPSSLLTINPGALFFNQINQNASIQNNSIAPAGSFTAGVDVFGLRVPDGKSLLLVGGNVSMDGGWAIASGGRIELGGLTEAGSIGIQENGNNFSLSFLDGVQRGDISLTNGAVVGVTGDGGGSIAINARNLDILAGSELFGGIGQGLGTTGTQAGNITIDTTGQIKLAGTNSLIFNSVQAEAVGNAGDITINTGSLEVTGGAQIDSLTRGQGNAGNITIQARDAVTFDGVDSNGFPSASFSDVQPGATGNGGSINITARSLSLTNGGLLGVDVRGASNTLLGGRGNGGTLNVNVQDAFTIGKDSSVFANLGAGATGRGGDVNIQAGNLFTRDGGEIISSTFGKGDSGKISITARDTISLDTEGIYSNVQQSDAVGNSGGISITTGSLSVINGAQINSFTSGQGNAGNITIQARDIVTFDGKDSNGNPSASFSNVLAGGVGNGGNISISAGSLSLTNGGYLNSGIREASSTLSGGQGIGGTVNINMRDALTIGKDSGVFANLGAGAIGRGGDVNIQAGNLFVKDGGEIISSTSGKGDSGKISITARDTISLDTSGIYSNVQQSNAVGNSGGISITTGSFFATNGAQINSFTRGRGNAGNITIQARDAVIFDGVGSNGFLSGSFSGVDTGAIGNGSSINITTSSLSLSNGGRLQVGVNEASNTRLGGQGNGGTLNINVRDALTIGKDSGVFANLGAGATGRGGDVNIQAGNLFVKDGGEIISSTSGKGDSGKISITVRDTISLDTSGIYSNVQQSNAVGNSGGISITTGSLSATNGAQINSFTRGQGNAGNITIQARDAVTFDGANSDGNDSSVSSTVESGAIGNGGNINITAGSLSLSNSGRLQVGVNAASNTRPGGQGIGGTLNINVQDALTIGKNSGVFANLGAGAIGRGGDIKVQAGNIFVKDGGDISSSISGKGDSGNISVTARDAIFLDAASSYISNNVQSSSAVGNAGNIDITTGVLSVKNGAQINSFTRGSGNAGNITIQARDAVTFDGVDSDGNESGLFSVVGDDAIGNGGTVSITSGSLSLNNGGRLGIYVSTASDALQGKKAIGGTANIDVRDAFTISGEGSGIFASLGSSVVGTGGDVNIKTGNLFIQDAGEISSFLGSGAEGRGGDINIQARNLFIKDGGEINSSTYGRGNSGKISITAHDTILLDTKGYIYSNVSNRTATGNSEGINISTGSLKITNRAGIFASTSGQGNGGNITVEAKDLVEILSGGDLESGVGQDAKGNSGNITIKTGRLIVRESQIGPSVFGEGNAGDFKIIASESVELSGQVRKREDDTSNAGLVGYPGGLFAQIDLLGKGRGGNLTVETRRLSVSDGSKIQAATFGDGDAGNVYIRADEIDLFETERPNFYNTGIFAGVQTDGRIEAGIIDPRNGRPPVGKGGNLTIETRTLNVRDGAEVFVQTTGEGDAGKILIRASESINVTGVSTGTLERQRTSKITAAASERSTGNGGSLTIETPLLHVADGGFISSSSQGKGTAGDINITANVARLNNGQIAAQTASTDGGNINLNLGKYLFLRNGSQISTTAGTAQAGGNGGNITINTPFLIAVPHENNDITANAFRGTGGNVNINARGIFGIEARSQPSNQTNDITASSNLGLPGTINVNSPDNSSIQNSLTELPTNAIDTNTLIANSCIVRSQKKQGSFTITGTGGLPHRPGEASMSNYSTGDVRNVTNENISRLWKKGDPIIEPQGVYRLSNGQLVMSRECQ